MVAPRRGVAPNCRIVITGPRPRCDRHPTPGHASAGCEQDLRRKRRRHVPDLHRMTLRGPRP
ncbi:hypothetical protein [Lysobacter gummosus]|uniref:hypothetical protein n=1 Tax=Lysobacter gummosus TaxID=262324 RepID=UPI00362ACA30